MRSPTPERSASFRQHLTPLLSLAVNAANDIYLADKGANEVAEQPPFGLGIDLFNVSQPDGVAVDAAGNVFVSSIGSNNIQRITPAGTSSIYRQRAFMGSSPSRQARDNVYVAAAAPNHDQKDYSQRNQRNRPELSAPASGNPTGVAVDALGDVFVSDSNVASIKEILPNGEHPGDWLGLARGPGRRR